MRGFFVLLISLGSIALRAQDHGHLNVGAVGMAQGDKLFFQNASLFTGAYVKTLIYTNASKFAGYFQGNITLTALHSKDAFGDPVAGGPAPGSFIIAEIVSVAGPVGGAFNFWETNSATSPAFNIPVGTANAAYRFDLSEAALGAGLPDGDPFGHIHGRRLSATIPGIYTVGFRALDVSTNGTNGGPIHTASDVLFVKFQAGINLGVAVQDTTSTTITIGAQAGYAWQIQAITDLRETSWRNVGDPVGANDLFVDVIDDQAVSERQFYRAIGTPIAP